MRTARLCLQKMETKTLKTSKGKLEIVYPKDFVVNREAKSLGRYKLGDKSLTGVTTILNVKAKPYLIDWSASESYKDCLTKSKEEILEVLKTKNYAHKKKGKDATDLGQLAHNWVDGFISACINDEKTELPSYEIEHIVNRFTQWALIHNVKFIAGDTPVFSQKYWYAGSFDFVCEIDGKVYLGDFKTSKQIDKEYFWQCAAYRHALKEMCGIEIDGSIVVRSDKLTDKELEEENKLAFEKYHSDKYNRKNFEVEYSFDYQPEFLTFLALKMVYEEGKNDYLGLEK